MKTIGRKSSKALFQKLWVVKHATSLTQHAHTSYQYELSMPACKKTELQNVSCSRNPLASLLLAGGRLWSDAGDGFFQLCQAPLHFHDFLGIGRHHGPSAGVFCSVACRSSAR